MQVIWLSALSGDTATCQWQSSCTTPSRQMARMQLNFFPPFISLPSSYFTQALLSPRVLSAGGRRSAWTSGCLKSKLCFWSNCFLSLCSGNLSSPQTEGNCCCTAGLAPAVLADEWQAGVMLVCLMSCKEIKKEIPACCRGECDLEAAPAGWLVFNQRKAYWTRPLILGLCQLALGIYWRTEGGSQILTGI